MSSMMSIINIGLLADLRRVCLCWKRKRFSVTVAVRHKGKESRFCIDDDWSAKTFILLVMKDKSLLSQLNLVSHTSAVLDLAPIELMVQINLFKLDKTQKNYLTLSK